MTDEKKVLTAADFKAKVDDLGSKVSKLMIAELADMPEDKRWFIYGRVVLFQFGNFYGMSIRSGEECMKQAEQKEKP